MDLPENKNRSTEPRKASLPAEKEPSRRPSGRISPPEDGERPEDPAERETETHLPAAASWRCAAREEGRKGNAGREGDKLSAPGGWADWSGR